MADVAGKLLGVSLCPTVPHVLAAETLTGGASAKSVIYLFMSGGMSHIDTFDPKPENPDVQGPISSIATRSPELRISEHLPELAKCSQLYSVVRSLHHTQGNHEPGTYKMRTGYEQRPDLIHPSLGAWVSKLSLANKSSLPKYLRVGGLAGHPANGFFEVAHAPLPMMKANEGLQNGRLREGMSPAEFERNLDVSRALDAAFVDRYPTPNVKAYVDLYDQATRMMESEEIAAFDIRREPAELREKYGNDSFGNGCLLARRLVEHGVRFIEVDHGSWDTHIDNHKGVQEASVGLDRGLSVLLADLSDRGLLESTLVVVATEFGRTPEIDQNLGRNHSPVGFSCLLAGGGIRGGDVYGATDANGHRVEKDGVTVYDFNSTIAHALGLPINEALAPTTDGQKFSIAGKDTATEKGKPLLALFG